MGKETYIGRKRGNVTYEVLNQIDSGGESTRGLFRVQRKTGFLTRVGVNLGLCSPPDIYVAKVVDNKSPFPDETFGMEYDALNRLQKARVPGVVQLIDVNATDRILFLEHIHGINVRCLVEKRKVCSSLEALAILGRTAQTIGDMHEEGVVHGDIKASNIILRAGSFSPILIDLANSVVHGVSDYHDQAKSIGHVAGTLQYLAPEQMQGRKPNKKSDIFSLGMVAYVMLTGGFPFKNETYESKDGPRLIYNHMQHYDMPEVPDCGEDERELVAAMLSIDPGERLEIPEVVDRVRFCLRKDHVTLEEVAERELVVV